MKRDTLIPSQGQPMTQAQRPGLCLGSSYVWRAISAPALPVAPLKPCWDYCSSAPLSAPSCFFHSLRVLIPSTLQLSSCRRVCISEAISQGKTATMWWHMHTETWPVAAASLGWRTTWTPAVLFVGSVLCVGGVGVCRNVLPRCICSFIHLFHSMSIYQMLTVCQSPCWLCLCEVYGRVVG